MLIWCFCGGIGLVPGGVVSGLFGQLMGYPQQWSFGLGMVVLGVVLAIVGGAGVFLTRKEGRPGAGG